MSEAGRDTSGVLRELDRWSVRLLSLVGRVRPDERGDVIGAFLTLVLFMSGHALLETARDSLFLAALPARRLPWVYLAIAVAALAIGRREPTVVRRISGRDELRRWLLAAAIVTGGFWVVAGTSGTWVVYALYVWSGVLATLVVVRFWTILSGRFTLTQAKRVFPLVASGSVIGAIVGSALARALTAVLPARHLVLAAALAFAAAAVAPRLWADGSAGGRRREQWRDLAGVGREILTRPYLRRVAIMVLLATVTFTLVDYVFKSVADRLVPTGELGEFFAGTYLLVNVLSLVVQLGLVGWLLRHLGLVSAVVVVPAILLLTTLGFAVGGGLTLALLLKVSDGALRHSLHRTGTELLFVPLTDGMRARVKGLIDVLGQRGGQAIASVLILMLLSTSATDRTFAAIACVTAATWLFVVGGLREHYLDLFRQTLDAEAGRSGSGFPSLDRASVDTLLETLGSTDDRRVVAALELLSAQGRTTDVPTTVLFHPSAPVVARALDLFTAARVGAAVEVGGRLLGHADGEVRAAALRLLSVLSPSRAVFEGVFEDPDPRAAITAQAAFVGCGWDDGSVAAAVVERARSGDATVRRAVARALAVRPTPLLERLVLDLVADPDTTVARESMRAAGALGTPGLIDPLIRGLGRRGVRDEARRALVGFGALGLARLADVLGDPAFPQAVRSQVPLTIAMSGAPQAPALLLSRLRDESDGLVRFHVLRALGRWRKEQPSFPLDRSLLNEALTRAVSTAFRMMEWRHVLEAGARARSSLDTELHRVLVALLRDKQDHALERAFRLLNLEAGTDEYRRVYLGLHSPLPQTRAGSRELLAHMVVPALRDPLLVLVEDLHGEHEATPAHAGSEPAYQDVLGEIIGCGMESASSLAAAHAAELDLHVVVAALEGTDPVSEEHAATLRRAARLLGGEAA